MINFHEYSLYGINELEILSYYNEPHRFYHNEKHLQMSLNCVNDMYYYNVEQSNLVRLAIVFHDIVYNTMRDDNEERSCDFMKHYIKTNKKHMRISGNEDQITYIETLIMATKSRNIPDVHQKYGGELGRDYLTMIDIDYIIFSKDKDVYEEYRANIRKEYGYLSDYSFYMCRLQFLKELIKDDKVYFTSAFISHHHYQAKVNINREIAELQLSAEKSKKFDFSEN